MATPPLLRARNALADGFQRDGADLASHLVNGVLTVLDWAKAFGSLIVHGITSGFMLGRGTNRLDDRGHAIVSDLIATQYSYAGPFADAVEAAILAGTPLSEDAIATRSGLYAGSVVNAHGIGESERFGISLPYYPSDLQTECGSNCRCAWSITDDGNIITAEWIAQDDGRVCVDCQARSDAAPIEFAMAA